MMPALRMAVLRNAGRSTQLRHAFPGLRKSGLPLLLLCTSALAGCAGQGIKPNRVTDEQVINISANCH